MVRPHFDTRIRAVNRKAKETCPECGKDVHDPDCAYNPHKAR